MRVANSRSLTKALMDPFPKVELGGVLFNGI